MRSVNIKWLAQGLRICQLADLDLKHRSADSRSTVFSTVPPWSIIIIIDDDDDDGYYYFGVFVCVSESNVNRVGIQNI